MKKLMIVALAVALSAVAQAASVTWGATKGYLYDGNGDNAVKITSGDAYLMFVTTTFTQDNLISAFVDSNGDAAATYTAMSGSGALAMGAGEIGANARIDSTESTYGLTSDAQAYFVVFANDKMYVSDLADMSYDNVSQSAEGAFTVSMSAPSKQTFEDATSYQGAGWYSAAAVPEPTSALMLLVGLAGLALKRKIA